MSDQHETSAPSYPNASQTEFTWHPLHRGKSFTDFRAELADEIGRDQRTYKLAMDGAEGAEHDSLTTIVDLERRWSIYDFDWSEMDPKVLADRILIFEQERERRREMLSFADYRASGALMTSADSGAGREIGSQGFSPSKVALVAVAVAVVVLLVLIAAVQ